jgi:hypothetical protein
MHFGQYPGLISSEYILRLASIFANFATQFASYIPRFELLALLKSVYQFNLFPESISAIPPVLSTFAFVPQSDFIISPIVISATTFDFTILIVFNFNFLIYLYLYFNLNPI